MHPRVPASVLAIFLAAGCTSVPTGPSVAVMPAPNKPFEVFAAEDRECRQYAEQSIGTTPGRAAAESEQKSIALGAAVGAAAGVAASGGNPNAAGTGAAAGMMGGAAAGAGTARQSQYEAQRRYDIAYEQCMYAKGNQLPPAPYYYQRRVPPPVYYPPPPPPGR